MFNWIKRHIGWTIFIIVLIAWITGACLVENPFMYGAASVPVLFLAFIGYAIYNKIQNRRDARAAKEEELQQRKS